MLKATQALFITLLLALTLALSPAAFGQGTETDNSSRNQLIFGGAAIVIMIIYVQRRNKRKKD